MSMQLKSKSKSILPGLAAGLGAAAVAGMYLAERRRSAWESGLAVHSQVAPADPFAGLICPDCQAPVRPIGAEPVGAVQCSGCQRAYPVVDGIVHFLRYDELQGPDRSLTPFYDWFSFYYLLFSRIASMLVGGEKGARRRIFDRLEPGGGRVLEVSIGPGVNLPYLMEMPGVREVCGLDISLGQLRQARAYSARLGCPLNLYLGNAERLPFADNSFDSVFHIGGINFFTNKAKAIQEMIRVAKPGSRLLIADESERGAKAYEWFLPGFGGLLGKHREPVVPPVALVPPEMEEVRLDEDTWKGWFYTLEFRKPAPAAG